MNTETIQSTPRTSLPKETPFDIASLKAAIANVEKEIREVKAVLRRPHTSATGSSQAALLYLRQEATQLYCLRALLRGRQHLKAKKVQAADGTHVTQEVTFADQKEVIGESWKLFLLPGIFASKSA